MRKHEPIWLSVSWDGKCSMSPGVGPRQQCGGEILVLCVRTTFNMSRISSTTFSNNSPPHSPSLSKARGTVDDSTRRGGEFQKASVHNFNKRISDSRHWQAVE